MGKGIQLDECKAWWTPWVNGSSWTCKALCEAVGKRIQLDECKARWRRGSSWTCKAWCEVFSEREVFWTCVLCCLKMYLQRLMAIQNQLYPSSKQFHRYPRRRHPYFTYSSMISSAKGKELGNTEGLAGYKLGQISLYQPRPHACGYSSLSNLLSKSTSAPYGKNTKMVRLRKLNSGMTQTKSCFGEAWQEDPVG